MTFGSIELIAGLAGIVAAVGVWFMLSLMAHVRAWRERTSHEQESTTSPEDEGT